MSVCIIRRRSVVSVSYKLSAGEGAWGNWGKLDVGVEVSPC